MGSPVRLPLEINPYVYVANNPLKWIDRTGEAAEGAAIGGSIGAVLGGVIGGLGGGAACTVVAPGVGTVGCGAGGATQGAIEGATIGAMIGSKIQDMCKDDDDECEELLKTDTATCNGIARIRGAAAGARCHASASQRYAACYRGQPLPPLDTWNN